MLKTIAAVSPELTQFVAGLNMPLNTPQHHHIIQIADGLVTTQWNKNLSSLYRHIVGNPCPKLAADTFREAPWQLDRFSLDTLADVYEVLAAFPDYHNTQRIHLGRACAGRTPDEAFPELPELPTLPETVQPNAWLTAYDGRV